MICASHELERRLKQKTDSAPIKFQGELSPIDFIETRLGVFDLSEKLREDSSGWLGELNTIMRILDPEAERMDVPNYEAPVALEGWTQLSSDLAIYRGEHYKVHGIWRLEKDLGLFQNPRTDTQGNLWKFFPMVSEAKFRWFDETVSYNVGDFREVRFKQGKDIRHYKRDIRDFTSAGTAIIAKETEREFEYFQDNRPMSRLTDLRGYTTSRDLPEEVRMGFYLRENGVPVPKTYGVYSELLQEYSFYEKINGVSPEQMIKDEFSDFLFQDATLLAKLAKCGLGKPGFADLDDKIYDGKTLWLVDWDECVRLVGADESLIYASNPFDDTLREEYKDVWRERYNTLIESAVTQYREVNNFSQSSINTYKAHFWNEMDSKR